MTMRSDSSELGICGRGSTETAHCACVGGDAACVRATENGANVTILRGAPSVILNEAQPNSKCVAGCDREVWNAAVHWEERL